MAFSFPERLTDCQQLLKKVRYDLFSETRHIHLVLVWCYTFTEGKLVGWRTGEGGPPPLIHGSLVFGLIFTHELYTPVE